MIDKECPECKHMFALLPPAVGEMCSTCERITELYGLMRQLQDVRRELNGGSLWKMRDRLADAVKDHSSAAERNLKVGLRLVHPDATPISIQSPTDRTESRPQHGGTSEH